jgi:hypothetical protein
METEPANSHWATRIGYGLAGLLIVYVLGIGPAGYLYTRSEDSPKLQKTLQTIYTPMFALEKTPLRYPVEIYTKWWVDLAKNRDEHSH